VETSKFTYLLSSQTLNRSLSVDAEIKEKSSAVEEPRNTMPQTPRRGGLLRNNNAGITPSKGKLVFNNIMGI